MTYDYNIDIGDLPGMIPVFPLNGALLLPHGQLPLHVFEDRYVAMVDDALLSAGRMIGMIQPRALYEDTIADDAPLFDTGCGGRIKSFTEIENGRYMITLSGVCRFHVAAELPLVRGYRTVRPDWADFKEDLEPSPCFNLDRDRLRVLLEDYFEMHDLSCDWELIDEAGDEKLITCLSMICPFDSREKQALLEAGCCRRRAEMFVTMVEIAVKDDGCCGAHCH